MDCWPYVLMGYWAISLAFLAFPIKKKGVFKHPTYLKALNGQGVLHVSHRGGSRDNVENTIQAFKHAVDLGTDCLEMDVCMTKDKQVIVIHDKQLQRICGVDALVQDYNYNDLPPFSDKIQLDFAVNDYIQTSTCSTLYFPKFEDVLRMFPNTLINVEIKTPEPEINKAVNDILIKHKREHSIIWGARYSHQNDELRALNPRIPRFFSLQRILQVYFLYFTGLLPFYTLVDDSLQLPMYTDGFYLQKLAFANSTLQRFATWLTHYIIWVFHLLSYPLFYHLSKRGILVIYWVLNNEKEYSQAISKRVNGIMTDSPQLLKDFLQKNKLTIRS